VEEKVDRVEVQEEQKLVGVNQSERVRNQELQRNTQIILLFQEGE
jgi:hypothetical protein